MRVYRCIKLQEVINKYKSESNEKLENDNMINSLLNNENNAASIRNAFELDDKNNRLYKNYE